jgi:opacity protein-like surface antigen
VDARRFIIRTTSAAALLLASLQSGVAADVAIHRKAPAPPPAAPANWTGFYLGGELGFDAASANYSRPQSAQSDISIGSANRGLIGGVYGGFNYQAMPWLVLGVEGALSTARVNYRELGPDIDFLQDTRHLSAVTARLGVVILPTTMVYAKAGPAWFEVRGFEGFGTPFTRTMHGELFGVGIEALATPNLALRLEGTYTRATETLLLNQAFDQYRPNILQMMAGAALKLDVPGMGAPAGSAIGPLLTKALYTKAPATAAPEAVHWTGFEVGGFGSVNYDKVRYLGSVTGEGGELGPFADQVIGGGVFAGVNVALSPNFVGGMEVSGNFQKADFSEASGVGFAPNIFHHFASVSEVYAATVRLGWLATPGTLFYGKVGPAWLTVSPDRAYWNAIAPNSSTGPVTLIGIQYGGGAETFVTSHFSVRVEGLYTELDDRPGALTFKGVQPNPFRLKPALLSGTLGAGYHF